MSLTPVAMIPLRALSDRQLNKRDLLVLAALGAHCTPKKPASWPGRARLAAMTGLTKERVTIATKRLEGFGYLSIKRSLGGSNNYYLNFANSDVASHQSENRSTETVSGGDAELDQTGYQNGIRGGYRNSTPKDSYKDSKKDSSNCCAADTARRQDFAFKGQVIELTPVELAEWQRDYPFIGDLPAALEAADCYYLINPEKAHLWKRITRAQLARENERLVNLRKRTVAEQRARKSSAKYSSGDFDFSAACRELPC